MAGKLVSIQVSDGGVPKIPVGEAAIGPGGLEGDRQRDLRHHGGPDRAVCLFSAEAIAALRLEGHPIDFGTTGENLTISGVPWPEVVPGARLRVGEVLLEIASYASPCSNVAGSFRDGEFTRISRKLHAGWSRVYARVVRGGTVRPGDPVELVPPA